MKILVLYSRAPFPLTNGGNLRLFHYARELHGDHDLDLCYYGTPPAPAEIMACFNSVTAFSRPAAPKGMPLWRKVRQAVSVEHMVPVSAEFRAHVSERLASGGYDLVWVGGNDMQALLPAQPGVPVLLDDCDFDLLAIRGLLKTTRSPLRWAEYLKLYLMTWRFNRRYHPRASAALYVSQADADGFRAQTPSVPVHVVENGVDTDYFRSKTDSALSLNLVFEGNMGFKPNVDVAQYLSRELMPRIRARLGEGVSLTIVGKDPAPEVKELGAEDIEITGFVEDVRPYLDRASVFVCPMRMGTGIKNKILQAWSMELPVVATPKSLGGLEARDGENVLVAHTSEEFAARTVDLLTDPTLREHLGNNGRQTVLQHYTWTRKAAQLESVMAKTARLSVPAPLHGSPDATETET